MTPQTTAGTGNRRVGLLNASGLLRLLRRIHHLMLFFITFSFRRLTDIFNLFRKIANTYHEPNSAAMFVLLTAKGSVIYNK